MSSLNSIGDNATPDSKEGVGLTTSVPNIIKKTGNDIRHILSAPYRIGVQLPMNIAAGTVKAANDILLGIPHTVIKKGANAAGKIADYPVEGSTAA